MPSHTGCICVGSPHCVVSNVSSNLLLEKMHSYTGCICLTFLHCAIFQILPQIARLREWVVALVALRLTFFQRVLKVSFHDYAKLHWLHLFNLSPLQCTVWFQMYPQTASQRECIITLGAFVWLFSTVCFQMSPQMRCLRRYIVTLVAFIWLFSTMCLQMFPQNVRTRGCIATLVAFAWLFSTMRFQIFLKLLARVDA